jgi:phage protein D
MDAWIPAEGDRVELRLGYEGEPLLGPILFEVDEPEWQGVPDTLRLKGLATPITASLRQKNTKAYEDTTLKAIAQQIAATHGLTLVGDVPEIKLERVTQKEQTDLDFLRDTAIEYGLIFKIDSASKLVFYKESELESAAAVMAIARAQLSRYTVRRGAKGTYGNAEVSYFDPKKGDYISIKIDAKGSEVTTPQDGKEDIASGDTLKIRERVENKQQAELKAIEALRRANRGQIEGDISTEGNPLLSAGINITLNGFRKLSGKYQVIEVQHKLSKSRGYQSSAKLKGLELKSEVQS